MVMAWAKNLPIALLKKDFIVMLPFLFHSNTEAVNEARKKNAVGNKELNGENVAELVR